MTLDDLQRLSAMSRSLVEMVQNHQTMIGLKAASDVLAANQQLIDTVKAKVASTVAEVSGKA